jgi:hypothetical protein
MRTAAAELEISMSCFRLWVRQGVLPQSEPGFPPSNRRWSWATICAWLAGDRTRQPADQKDLFGRKPRGPKPGAANAGRPRKAQAATPDENGIEPLSDEDFAEMEIKARGPSTT